ncbi:LysE family translocator [Spirillospora sp. NPDC000708]
MPYGRLDRCWVSLGQAAWTVAAALGLAGLVHASQPAFWALKIAGTAYLLWLGGQSLWRAWRGQRHGGERQDGRSRLSAGRALRQGLINDLANPKMAAFLMSLLPQFAPVDGGALAAMLCLLTFVWLALYSLVIDKAKDALRRSAVRRVLEALTGSVLVGFAARLALTPR